MTFSDELLLRDIQNLRAYADGARQRAESDVKSTDRATLFGGIGVALGALEVVAERAAKLAAAFERQCAMREDPFADEFAQLQQMRDGLDGMTVNVTTLVGDRVVTETMTAGEFERREREALVRQERERCEEADDGE